MRKLLSIVSSFLLPLSSFLFISCSQDAYDKGEGQYSWLRGDFAEAIVNSNQQVTKIVTDDGDELPLVKPYEAKWIMKADTTYRCMLYYNKVENQAEVVSMGQVPCASITLLKDLNKPLLTDPVKFESTWMSKTGKYLNMSLMLMTGVSDDSTAVQSLAIVSDTLVKHADGKHTRHLILYHDQGNVPEYYSTKVYMSIPTNRIDADSVRISINSYDGEVITKHRIR